MVGKVWGSFETEFEGKNKYSNMLSKEPLPLIRNGEVDTKVYPS